MFSRGAMTSTRKLGLKWRKSANGAQRDIGLAHPDFIGQIGDALRLEDVVDRDRALELLVGASVAPSDARREIEQLTRRRARRSCALPPPLGLGPPRGTNVSNQSRNAGISTDRRAISPLRIESEALELLANRGTTSLLSCQKSGNSRQISLHNCRAQSTMTYCSTPSPLASTSVRTGRAMSPRESYFCPKIR